MTSGILDAFGRPIRKDEVEQLSKRGIMLPAQALFSGFHQQYSDEYSHDFSPFVEMSGTSRYNEETASWMANSQPSSPYSNLNSRFAHKNPIEQLNIPRDTQGLMTQSLIYAQDNYIVSRAVRVKRNFALRDMQFLGSTTTRDFYASEFKRLKVRSILAHVFRYYWSTGRCVVYWGDDRPVQRLAILDPRSIIVRRVLGQNKVYLIPDSRWKAILERGKGISADKDQECAFLKKYLPKYWIKYILSGSYIPLNDNSYALIENDLELFSLRGIDSPSNLPLQPAFGNLAVLDMMIAGDFSVAWMLKHMIALVSIGDPKAEGQNYTRPDQNELNKLRDTFQRPDYSIWAYVDPTVDVRWIAPDPKLFNDAKYKHHVEAVEWCMGVPSVFSRSDGSFAASALSLKPFREEIEIGRTDVEEQFFAKLFPVLREGVTARKSGGKDPQVSFDVDCLKDDRVLMDELTGKYDRGAVSIRSLLAGKAEDFDTEVARKKEELKMAEATDGLFEPMYDPAHGTMDEGGRPSGGGPPKPEAQIGQQQSRPSRGV